MKAITLFLLLMSLSQVVNAIAYCSLRDPVAQIAQLFPHKTNQLSIVKEVNEDTRQSVKQALPSYDLHFSELGQHTLYVAMEAGEALGYIHVRSEQSEWGLVEIVWALDKHLTIIDFAFQRCRSPKKAIIEDEQFKSMFIGQDFQSLKALLNNDGVSVNHNEFIAAKKAPELANVVMRCALKTLLITDLLWRDELQKIKHK